MDPVLDPFVRNPRCPWTCFSPSSRDDQHLYWDNTFDGKTLKAGTVAGGITPRNRSRSYRLRTKLLDSSRLTIPPSKGVVTDLSISNQTTSSFQVDVKGYSTPRETGDSAKTCRLRRVHRRQRRQRHQQKPAVRAAIGNRDTGTSAVSLTSGEASSPGVSSIPLRETPARSTPSRRWHPQHGRRRAPVCVSLKTGQKGTCPN